MSIYLIRFTMIIKIKDHENQRFISWRNEGFVTNKIILKNQETIVDYSEKLGMHLKLKVTEVGSLENEARHC